MTEPDEILGRMKVLGELNKQFTNNPADCGAYTRLLNFATQNYPEEQAYRILKESTGTHAMHRGIGPKGHDPDCPFVLGRTAPNN